MPDLGGQRIAGVGDAHAHHTHGEDEAGVTLAQPLAHFGREQHGDNGHHAGAEAELCPHDPHALGHRHQKQAEAGLQHGVQQGHHKKAAEHNDKSIVKFFPCFHDKSSLSVPVPVSICRPRRPS
ncbi:hypothetical protein SDC9_175820 [bioreactor metagenome]|uniref:Uncharacterized protein n=1 Tax=bioreactor metagenome TaxID=1076179 RepID=A0A645GRC3_9ZZZZ